MLFSGELAAIGTAFLFSISSTFFTFAGRETAAGLVNRSRLAFALIFTLSLHWLWQGRPVPFDLDVSDWAWMGLSGFIGLALGDACLFEAFVRIGARLAMLVFSLAPIFAALLSRFFLGEDLNAGQWTGIGVAVSGVALVVGEPAGYRSREHRRDHRLGLAFAFGGAVGQALGLVTAKVGLSAGCPALSGNLIRILAAVAALWLLTILRGQTRSYLRTMRGHPRALGWTLLGSLAGPVLGVWLSLVAIERAPVGIASTLMGLTPIFLLPIARVVMSEAISRRAVFGTLVAVFGVSLLFL